MVIKILKHLLDRVRFTNLQGTRTTRLYHYTVPCYQVKMRDKHRTTSAKIIHF